MCLIPGETYRKEANEQRISSCLTDVGLRTTPDIYHFSPLLLILASPHLCLETQRLGSFCGKPSSLHPYSACLSHVVSSIFVNFQ